MKPYYQDKAVTIYHGDCRDILPGLPKVDLVLTDPPYNVSKNYGASGDNRSDYQEWCHGWMSLCFDKLEDHGTFYLKHLPCHAGWVTPILSRYIFISHIIWPNASGAFHMERRYYPKYEIIYVYGKTSSYIFNQFAERATLLPKKLRWGSYRTKAQGQMSDIWDDIPFIYAGSIRHPEAIMEPGTNFKAHPCQMPEELARRGISFSTNSEMTILDPFLGSGTTAYCAKKLNRKCIGIEIEEKYCEIASNRCRQMVMELKV